MGIALGRKVGILAFDWLFVRRVARPLVERHARMTTAVVVVSHLLFGLATLYGLARVKLPRRRLTPGIRGVRALIGV